MMLTSAGQRGDAPRCRELGIAVYLIKPIRQSELLEAILAALGKAPPGKDGRQSSPATPFARIGASSRFFWPRTTRSTSNSSCAFLRSVGHVVTVASNGNEASGLAQEYPDSTWC